jgi:hypothetical protein
MIAPPTPWPKPDPPRKFDARKTWARLSTSQRRAVGEAALLLHVSQQAQDGLIDGPVTPVLRRWEHAEQMANRLLDAAVPCDFDLYPEGPDLAALGIRACRECGCTDEDACPGGCGWVEPDLCSQCAGDPEEEDHPKLGPCCMCEGAARVHNIIMLSRRCAVPGTGWGCVACELPADGAYAVLCDGCLALWDADPSLLKFAIKGYPASGERVPIAELPEGVFDHDMTVDHG